MLACGNETPRARDVCVCVCVCVDSSRCARWTGGVVFVHIVTGAACRSVLLTYSGVAWRGRGTLHSTAELTTAM